MCHSWSLPCYLGWNQEGNHLFEVMWLCLRWKIEAPITPPATEHRPVDSLGPFSSGRSFNWQQCPPVRISLTTFQRLCPSPVSPPALPQGHLPSDTRKHLIWTLILILSGSVTSSSSYFPGFHFSTVNEDDIPTSLHCSEDEMRWLRALREPAVWGPPSRP